MAEPASSAILMKLGIDLVARPAQRGLARLTTWAAGHEVLVLGPARAGKTSFAEYLQYGILEKEQETATTVNTHQSASFRVKIGRSDALELKVRRTVDLPGEYGAMKHAQTVEERKPRAVLVILNLSAPLMGASKHATGPWLVTFSKYLASKLRTDEKLRKKLKCILFVANQRDKIEETLAAKKIAAIRRIVEKHLGDSFEPGATAIQIMPCILVENPNFTALADAVIVRLAKALA
jgi:GTPase SAR1 family protein